MKCLMAIDGSAGSEDAVRFLGQLLDPARDQVVLYYALPDLQIRAKTQVAPAVVEQARAALGNAVLDRAAALLPPALQQAGHGRGGRIERIVGAQRAAHGILVAAEETKVDWIAVGARGVSPLKGMLVGSVSRQVALEAHVPVLVVRQPNPSPRREGVSVLMACASAARGEGAAKFLSQLHWPAGSTGRALVVLETLLGGEVPAWLAESARSPEADSLARVWVEQHEAEIKSQRDALATMCHDLPAPFQKEPPLVLEGHPAEQILKAAQAHAADLLVVGKHRAGKVARWFLGSTTEHVLSHASCSVLVVPDHEMP